MLSRAIRATFGTPIALVLLIAVAMRGGALVAWSGRLSEDRDAYLSIARQVADGHGFSNESTGHPTAYRPPLYPLVLAAIYRVGGGPLAIGIFQAVLGAATVFLTWRLGLRLGLGRGATLAAAIVAVDPLLVQYTTYAMTETLHTFLTTALLTSIVAVRKAVDGRRSVHPGPLSVEARVKRDPSAELSAAVSGLLLGACALTRPTTWAFVAVLAALEAASALRAARTRRASHPSDAPESTAASSPSTAPSTTSHRRLGRACLALGVAGIVVSPWFVRNLVVFHAPILTTTHGGYTLLLGNNPVAWQEEVDKPWGTTWDDAAPGRRQEDWLGDVQAAIRAELGDAPTEVESDRWMSRRARSHIREAPGTFVRACWLRVRRLWNVAPLGQAAAGLPQPVVWGVAMFYTLVLASAIAGFVRLPRREWDDWLPLAALIVSVTLVHSAYWSNARMRAPVMPAVALFAARGLTPCRMRGSGSV